MTETLEWVQREMTSPEGGFYCALDADSEGVEGKFYTFQRVEIERILGEDAELFIRYFGVTQTGNWEEEHTNVLKIDIDADKMAQEAGFSEEEWSGYLAQGKQKLLDYRNKRVKPGLDNKKLTSWNSLMIKAFVDAHRVFNVPEYLRCALDNAAFIREHLYAKDGGLLHQPAANGKTIPGFLDDYAFCIEAFQAIYEATFDESWAYEAKRLMEYVLTYFYDQHSVVFYYTSSRAETLIARKQEVMDNVIPSSTSGIVRALNRLGLIFDEQRYLDIASQALANVVPQMAAYGSAYSNWAIQLLEEVVGSYQVVMTGPGWRAFRTALDAAYLPNKLILGGTKGDLPLLTGRVGDTTRAYVCRGKTCSLPVEHIEALLQLITQ